MPPPSHSPCSPTPFAADLQMKLTLQQDVPKRRALPAYLPACLPACCLVGIFGLHCIAQIPYLLSMLIAQNCTKVLTFVTHRKLAFHMPHTTAAPLQFPLCPLPLPASKILRIFQLQFAQLFNDKLPNVSDSTSNYAIVCSVRQALPSPVPLECPIRMAF